MVCVHCGQNTRVINSRHQRRTNQIWRRRRCEACNAVFTSIERPEHGQAWLVRRQGAVAPFSRDKLLLSLYRSLQHRSSALEDAGGLTETVVAKLTTNVNQGELGSHAIAHICQVALNRFDKAASVHYAAFHKLG